MQDEMVLNISPRSKDRNGSRSYHIDCPVLTCPSKFSISYKGYKQNYKHKKAYRKPINIGKSRWHFKTVKDHLLKMHANRPHVIPIEQPSSEHDDCPVEMKDRPIERRSLPIESENRLEESGNRPIVSENVEIDSIGSSSHKQRVTSTRTRRGKNKENEIILPTRARRVSQRLQN